MSVKGNFIVFNTLRICHTSAIKQPRILKAKSRTIQFILIKKFQKYS